MALFSGQRFRLILFFAGLAVAGMLSSVILFKVGIIVTAAKKVVRTYKVQGAVRAKMRPLERYGAEYVWMPDGSIVSLEFDPTVGRKLDDEGLRLVSQLDSLQELDLSNTCVTDSGLRSISTLKRLRVLDLSNTAATDQGVRDLQTTLSDCKIKR